MTGVARTIMKPGRRTRCTFIADPENIIQHVYATNLNVGRSPKDTLRVWTQ